MKYLKDNLFFALAFSVTILVFLYPLIFMRSSFLSGDSFAQFYPWFKCYSESLKNFNFSYWARSMGSGFPLMAEGQIGGFYPFNIIIFFILPFKAAYNYSIIFHFIIGGIFTYMYARRIGSDEYGGYLSALLFCFGSAYAGSFYNIITLRTLAWFPLSLLLFELYFNHRHVKYLFLTGVILGFQLLGGFVQMAVYCAVFYMVYYIYRAVYEKIRVRNILVSVLLFLTVAFLVALPQLLLSYQLSLFSGREGATLGFALWRSFLPYGLLGTIFPYSLSSPGAHLYVGVLSLLFVIGSFFMVKNNSLVKAQILILFLSLFLALGWLNPLYVGFLNITKLYFFRNPSKFLFFGAFSLSILAGYGFTEFFESGNDKGKQRAAFIFRLIIFIAVASFFAVKYALTFYKKPVMGFGYSIVKNFIYGKPHHRHPLGHYTDVLNSLYDKTLDGLSFSDIFVVLAFVFITASILIVPFLLKRKLKGLCAAVIFFDIVTFGFYGIGFGGSIKSFSCLDPDSPAILKRIKSDSEICRILPLDISSRKLPNWAYPNSNMLYGLDSVACYTPLATKVYKNILANLEVVDDSLGLKVPAENALVDYTNILRLLNVKYIISHRQLPYPFLRGTASDGETYLYELKDYLPRIFFSYNVDGPIKDEREANFVIREYRDGFVSVEMTAPADGYIVFSENYYPGWAAYVDGRQKPIKRLKEIVQVIDITKGAHRVIFKFNPEFGYSYNRE